MTPDSTGLLLDTCTWLWLASDQKKLSPTAREEIGANPDALYVSAISAFEIGIKHARGSIVLPMPPWAWIRLALRHHGIRTISVTARVATAATQLPPLHYDPCDRIIVATAQYRRMTILTPDTLIAAYPDTQVLW